MNCKSRQDLSDIQTSSQMGIRVFFFGFFCGSHKYSNLIAEGCVQSVFLVNDVFLRQTVCLCGSLKCLHLFVRKIVFSFFPATFAVNFKGMILEGCFGYAFQGWGKLSVIDLLYMTLFM